MSPPGHTTRSAGGLRTTELQPMHDLIVGLAFVTMLMLPSLIALRADKSENANS